jgi:acyl-CoA thioesterase FadM
MGYVYYGNYAHCYEESAAEAIRAFGMPYREMEKNGRTMLPITASGTSSI